MYKNRVLPDCPEGTELHPRKKICVEKCKPNRIRDPKTFKCVKDPTAHVVNPLTGRQVQYGYLHKIKTKRSKVLQGTMRRQLAQKEHLDKSRNAMALQGTMRRQLAQKEHLDKSRDAMALQASMRRHVAQRMHRKSTSSSSSSSHRQVLSPDQPFIPPDLAKKSTSSSSSSSPKHHMRFLDGKRKGTDVYISKNKRK
jgi:hypothetical protein